MPNQKAQWEMPGRKKFRTAIVCLAAWTAVGAPQTPKPPPQPSVKSQPARRAPELGPKAEFLGWDGERAVFREETELPTGKSGIAYYAWSKAARLKVIPQPKKAAPAKFQPGAVLLSDFTSAPGSRSIAFRLHANPEEVAALGSAIAKWTEEGTGKRRSFPFVHATLIVGLTKDGKEEIVWKKRRDLTATPGEAGYVYDPPRLRFAAISPAGSTLLIELVNSAGSEFVLIPLLKKK